MHPMVDTDYAVTTAGSAFSFSESAVVGDVTLLAATSVTTTTGTVDDLPTYGEVVTGCGWREVDTGRYQSEQRRHDSHRRRRWNQCDPQHQAWRSRLTRAWLLVLLLPSSAITAPLVPQFTQGQLNSRSESHGD